MESFLERNMFRNPFSGVTNSGNGILEHIANQVSNNNETLGTLKSGLSGIAAYASAKGFPENPNDTTPPRDRVPPGEIRPRPHEPILSDPGWNHPVEVGPGYPGYDLGPPVPIGGLLDPGPINVDELNKQHPGIEQGFFESDEYKKFHTDPANMMGTMNAVFSKYFGGQGSGSVSAAQDAAYEAYLKRIGKSDLIGKNVSGLPNNWMHQGMPSGGPSSMNLNEGLNPLFGRAFAGKPI
tara:strand:+ start:57 stop:770 length:714 start_codon:yes stop_codon:yes gene_type:complete